MVIIDSILPFIYMIYINEKEVWVEEAYNHSMLFFYSSKNSENLCWDYYQNHLQFTIRRQ